MHWYRLACDHIRVLDRNFDITVNEYFIDLFSSRGKVTNFTVNEHILKFIAGSN